MPETHYSFAHAYEINIFYFVIYNIWETLQLYWDELHELC